ncbi:hypothetical protein GLAREA_09384 [Glarea lozoyensis ATCC 20868]|uniref:Nephrocystin 3-like N-terminal domain-containing protein n=1 Tax=Glarea lozoyensis (strain ATCC 20868 / MF5171) TaxID=1116229 RepID=S3CT96_GLAL2|nr:uncharacterized protein GLAREA_09384 [Glarea lozoyensis ATCC 20868]EPE28264.1 hypothetical protein GLAREA_09384 [Glarea lozoyensis ATCC 20868]
MASPASPTEEVGRLWDKALKESGIDKKLIDRYHASTVVDILDKINEENEAFGKWRHDGGYLDKLRTLVKDGLGPINTIGTVVAAETYVNTELQELQRQKASSAALSRDSLEIVKFHFKTHLDPSADGAITKSELPLMEIRKCAILETGQWLFEKPEYLEWTWQKSRILRISGDPGTGKSHLASSIIKDISDQFGKGSKTLIAYFFFKFTSPHRRSVENALRSCIIQIAQRNEVFRERVARKLEDDGVGLDIPMLKRDRRLVRATYDSMDEFRVLKGNLRPSILKAVARASQGMYVQLVRNPGIPHSRRHSIFFWREPVSDESEDDRDWDGSESEQEYENDDADSASVDSFSGEDHNVDGNDDGIGAEIESTENPSVVLEPAVRELSDGEDPGSDSDVDLHWNSDSNPSQNGKKNEEIEEASRVRVELVHAAFRDYLGRAEKTDSVPPLVTRLSDSKLELALRTLKATCDRTPRGRFFRKYAFVHWADHLFDVCDERCTEGEVKDLVIAIINMLQQAESPLTIKNNQIYSYLNLGLNNEPQSRVRELILKWLRRVSNIVPLVDRAQFHSKKGYLFSDILTVANAFPAIQKNSIARRQIAATAAHAFMFSEAAAELKAALETSEDELQKFENGVAPAWLESKQGKLGMACQKLEETLASHSAKSLVQELGRALFMLGDFYAAQQDYSNALRTYERGMEVTPIKYNHLSNKVLLCLDALGGEHYAKVMEEFTALADDDQSEWLSRFSFEDREPNSGKYHDILHRAAAAVDADEVSTSSVDYVLCCYDAAAINKSPNPVHSTLLLYQTAKACKGPFNRPEQAFNKYQRICYDHDRVLFLLAGKHNLLRDIAKISRGEVSALSRDTRISQLYTLSQLKSKIWSVMNRRNRGQKHYDPIYNVEFAAYKLNQAEPSSTDSDWPGQGFIRARSRHNVNVLQDTTGSNDLESFRSLAITLAYQDLPQLAQISLSAMLSNVNPEAFTYDHPTTEHHHAKAHGGTNSKLDEDLIRPEQHATVVVRGSLICADPYINVSTVLSCCVLYATIGCSLKIV